MTNETSTNWKTKLLLEGALIGAILGAATAYLMARASEENEGGPPSITTMDALKVGIGLVGIVRSIASLGDRK